MAAALAMPPLPPATAQEGPVPAFSSAVGLVRITVVVRDRSGALVRGLKREDFEVVEDGKPQTIEAFEFEDVPIERTRQPEPAAPAPPGDSFGDAGRNTVVGPSTFLVNMTLIKNISLGRPRTLSLRVSASNVFNTPPLVGIDTVVNSPTYAQVVQVGSMRSIQLQTRFRF